MFNSEEIKIAQIKNLRLIYIYKCNEELHLNKSPYFGLRIAYDNNKTLDYNYKDEYFNEYLSKVISVYNKEKNIRKINFLDEITKSIFEEIDSVPQIQFNTYIDSLQDYRITSFNNKITDISLIIPYIKDLILNFLYAVFQKETVEIISLKGFNNKFICECVVDDKEIVIPIILIKTSYNKFKFNFSYFNKGIINVEGNIDLYNNRVVSEWVNENKTLKGKNVYHLEEDKTEKYIEVFDEPIFYDNEINLIKEEEKNIINNYLNLFNIGELSNVTKLLNNSYVLKDEKVLDNNITLRKSVIGTFNSNIIQLLYRENYGIEKNQIFISLDEEIINITAKIETINDKNVLIIEKSYIEGINTNGEYKKELVNKYNYDYYIIDGSDLLKPFNVIEKIEQQENIKNSYQLKI